MSLTACREGLRMRNFFNLVLVFFCWSWFSFSCFSSPGDSGMSSSIASSDSQASKLSHRSHESMYVYVALLYVHSLHRYWNSKINSFVLAIHWRYLCLRLKDEDKIINQNFNFHFLIFHYILRSDCVKQLVLTNPF